MGSIPRFWPTIGATAAAALLLSGCGSSSSDEQATTNSSPQTVETIAAMLPSDVQDKGTLVMGTGATYPPMEFVDEEGNVVGMEVDIAEAVGAVLGLEVEVKNASFDTLIPGLMSGRFDIALSSMNDTKEREKKVDFITVRDGGSSFVIDKNGGPNVQSLSDLCGLTAGVKSGSTQHQDVKTQAKECAKNNEPKLKIDVFDDENQMFLALSSGRLDVVVGGGPGNAYTVKQSGGKFKVSGPSYDVSKSGIAVPKDNGMAKPLQAAVNEIIENGTYEEILEKWGQQEAAIKESEINIATS